MTRGLRLIRSARTGVLRQVPMPIVFAALVAAVLTLVLCGVAVGSTTIEVARIVQVVQSHLNGDAQAGPDDFIIWSLRIPRVILAAVVGAALAVAGAAVQALVRNPIADPYVLGLSSGAGVAATLVITTLGAASLAGWTLSIAAGLGAATAGVLVFAASVTGGVVSANRLVLVGVAVAQLLAGVMSFIIVSSGDPAAAQQVMVWLLGSLAGAHWGLVGVLVGPVAVGIVVIWALSRRLDLLALGDDVAAAAGATPAATRLALFAAAALLTGAAVSVSGTIGFVGLIVPHLARLLVGPRHAQMVPVTALLGAALLVLADILARTILAPSEVPIGIFTAFIGVPIFIVLLGRSRQVWT